MSPLLVLLAGAVVLSLLGLSLAHPHNPFHSIVPDQHDSFPWGPSKIGEGSCPIHYPWSNETRFCLSVGRQRAIVEVSSASSSRKAIACVELPWRIRSDIRAFDSIDVYVMTPSGNFTPAVKSGGRIHGEVCFETLSNNTKYAIYYLPIAYALDLGTGSYHSHFLTSRRKGSTFESAGGRSDMTTRFSFGRKLGYDIRSQLSVIPASFVRFESFQSHDVRSQMEFAASKDETQKLIDNHPSSPYLTWISTIENTTDETVRMDYDLPLVLTRTPPNDTVTVPLDTGVRVVQVILYAAREPIRDVEVGFLPLENNYHDEIVELSCLQTSGTNYRGEQMVPPPIELEIGQVGHLLILVEPKRANIPLPANYAAISRTVRVTPKGLPSIELALNFKSHNENADSQLPLAGSFRNPSEDVWRLARLAWLNSKTGLEETITRPYTPIAFSQSQDGSQWTFHFLGRNISICSKTGLPRSMTSNGRSILSLPVSFRLTMGETNETLTMYSKTTPGKIKLGPNNSSVAWNVEMMSEVEKIKANVRCVLGYDGHLDYSIALFSSSGEDMNLTNASLTINVERELARFAVGGGFGGDGDFFPKDNASKLNYFWRDKDLSGWRLWIGDVDAGMYLKLKGIEDAWNEANPIGAKLPPSWSGANGSTGGIQVSELSANTIKISAFSGPIHIAKGSPLHFNFSIIATPTKGDFTHSEEGKREHYQYARHFHVPYGQWDPPEDPCNIFNTTISGPTTLILHQSNRLNPYINWPFHPNTLPELYKYTKRAKTCGVTVKIYFTVHELSNHCVELHALRGLNGEVFLRRTSDEPPVPGLKSRRRLGQGGDLKGSEWLLEHVVRGYEGAWFTQNPGGEEDSAIFDNVTSRFLNYYIEGQRWLYDNIGIGGLYYDGFNSERRVQQRIRRIRLSEGAGQAHADKKQLIRFDVHGRPFDYTELMPYVDSMWTAEGIDFTKGPAYWLVSISALPFGTFGEMLGADINPPVEGHRCGESCANKYRGMLFGMTNRAGWNGKDPNGNLQLWKLWDDIEIHKASMFGWWNKSCPVRILKQTPESSSLRIVSDNILATAYVRNSNLTLIAIASWSSLNQSIALEIDWESIGLNKETSSIFAPSLPSFNTAVRSKDGLRMSPANNIYITVPAYEGWLLVVSS